MYGGVLQQSERLVVAVLQLLMILLEVLQLF